MVAYAQEHLYDSVGEEEIDSTTSVIAPWCIVASAVCQTGAFGFPAAHGSGPLPYGPDPTLHLARWLPVVTNIWLVAEIDNTATSSQNTAVPCASLSGAGTLQERPCLLSRKQ